ncbi:hypothetical protein A2U01_0113812, partial [Trifolium medium]|nr:hypothetical protein [Trifolium medium]
RAFQRASKALVAFSRSSQEFSNSCSFPSLSVAEARNFQLPARLLSLDLAQRACQEGIFCFG